MDEPPVKACDKTPTKLCTFTIVNFEQMMMMIMMIVLQCQKDDDDHPPPPQVVGVNKNVRAFLISFLIFYHLQYLRSS